MNDTAAFALVICLAVMALVTGLAILRVSEATPTVLIDCPPDEVIEARLLQDGRTLVICSELRSTKHD